MTSAQQKYGRWRESYNYVGRFDRDKGRDSSAEYIVRILQGNIDRGRAAMDLMNKMAEEQKADIIIMAEPNKKRIQQVEWLVDNRVDVAIEVRNSNIKIIQKGAGDGFVFIETSTLVVYGCYISPNIDLGAFNVFLLNLRQSMQKHAKEIIVGGDFNAKSYQWNSKVEDRRGQMLVEWLAEEDLIVHNRGDIPTFIRGNSESYIDITFSSRKIADKVRNWHIIEEENLSFHQHIYFEVSESRNIVGSHSGKTKKGWRFNEENMAKVAQEVGRQLRHKAVTSAEEFVSTITTACDNILPRKKFSNLRKPVYWWSDEIAEKRRNCLRDKRLMVRANKGMDGTYKARCREKYTQSRAALKAAITVAKRSAWKKLINEIDSDVWGKAYQIVTQKLRAKAPATLAEDEQMEIAKKLFPVVPITPKAKLYVKESEIPLFTIQELEDATKKLREKKAPGPDGITAEAIKAIVKESGGECLAVFNKVLTAGVFPDIWKVARLVLIEKGKKPNQQGRAYRPICLLDCLGKLLEQLLLGRLKKEIDAHGGLSSKQHGFREGRSTITALNSVKEIADEAYCGPYSSRKLCALITLDIQNAFNTVPWEGILTELKKREVAPYLYNTVASYFENRLLLIGDGLEMVVSCGVPQGSVLGPTLWNLLYDDILSTPVPKGVSLIAYADDLAVVVVAKTKDALELAAEHALHNVKERLSSKGLKLAPEKTEMVLLVGGRKTKNISVNLEGEVIQSQNTLKYLGVHLDRNMRLGFHIRKRAEKAGKAMTTIRSLMPNLGGPSEHSRRILVSIVHSMILYGASIWMHAMERENHRRVLISVQRSAAIRVVRAYRTTSTKALLVLARMPPIDMLARQRGQAEKERHIQTQEEYLAMVDKWQNRWEANDGTANWTRRMIPDIRPWLSRKHGDIGYHMSQVLTGHGCFGAYLKRFGIKDTDECVCCGATDTVEHTFYECAYWQEVRRDAEQQVGNLTPENTVEKMLENEENWKTISNLAKIIIEGKVKKQREEPEHL